MADQQLHARHVLLHCFKQGSTTAQAEAELKATYGAEAPGIRQIYRWYAKFRADNVTLEDLPRSGRPRKVEDAGPRHLLEQDSNLSTDELAEKLDVDTTTVFRHLKTMGYRLKLDTWVPHTLTPRNKVDRFVGARDLLARFEREGEAFLQRIVTGDEKWIVYNNALRRRSWKRPYEAPRARSKGGLHPAKVQLSIWWDATGVLYYELLPQGETITAAKYCEQLEALRQALARKRPTLLNRKGVILQHDNARPHTAENTLQKVKNLAWEILPHPPYSPDLSPSDFHLFRALQNSLNGENFCGVGALTDHLDAFFASKSEAFFRNGLLQLPQRWRKVVENQGDYFID